MPDEAIKPGDTVRLKSGSPLMTVTSAGPDSAGVLYAHTAWFDGTKNLRGHFPQSALMAASPDEAGPLVY